MNAPQTSTPIDRQQITLPSAAAIVLITFGVGAGWTIHENRLGFLEKQAERTERLLNKICGKLQCDAEGMRE